MFLFLKPDCLQVEQEQAFNTVQLWKSNCITESVFTEKLFSLGLQWLLATRSIRIEGPFA